MVDYTTETGLALKGIFGIDFLDREDFERLIDFRNNMNNSQVAWLIERDDCELAAWWLSSRHNALEENLWSDVTDMPREKDWLRLRHDARKLANNFASPTRSSATWRTSKAICRGELSDE